MDRLRRRRLPSGYDLQPDKKDRRFDRKIHEGEPGERPPWPTRDVRTHSWKETQWFPVQGTALAVWEGDVPSGAERSWRQCLGEPCTPVQAKRAPETPLWAGSMPWRRLSPRSLGRVRQRCPSSIGHGNRELGTTWYPPLTGKRLAVKVGAPGVLRHHRCEGTKVTIKSQSKACTSRSNPCFATF